MQDDLIRAQHYRALATQMRSSAEQEQDAKRKRDLEDVAEQYTRLAEKLIARGATRPAP